MISLRTLAAVVGAAGLTIGAANAVAAQDQGAAPAPGAAGQHHWDPAAMKARMEARRAEHARVLHDALSIRPDQEGAFQAFMASMTPQHKDHGMRGGEHQQDAHAMTTPERLDRMSKRMAEHQARFEQRAQATKTFYAALSPSQQRTFDALAMMRRHGGRGRMGHGGMRGHWGGQMGGQMGGKMGAGGPGAGAQD